MVGASAYTLLAQLLSGAFTAALAIFLVRRLGPTEYGVFAVAVSVSLVLVPVADLGVSQATARFLAERSDDPRRAWQVMASALRLKVPLATLVGGTLTLSAPLLARALDVPAAEGPLRVMGAVVLGQSLLLLVMAAFVALRRNLVRLKVTTFESSLEASVSVALVLLAGGAMAAAVGRAIGFAAGGAVAVLVLWRHLARGRGEGASPLDPVPLSQIARYGAALGLIEGVWAIFDRLDVLMIAVILGPREAGLFEAVLRLTAIAAYVGIAIGSGFAPRAAHGAAGPMARGGLVLVLRVALVIHIGLAAAIAVWAPSIVEIALGATYLPAADVLRLLGWTVLLLGLAPLLSMTLNYRGLARQRIVPAVACLAVNFALDLVLIPSMGIEGAALATGIALSIYTGWHLRLCATHLELELRPLARTAAFAVAAAAVMAGVFAAVGTHHGVLVALAGLVAGVAAYGLVLAASGELSGMTESWRSLTGRAAR